MRTLVLALALLFVAPVAHAQIGASTDEATDDAAAETAAPAETATDAADTPAEAPTTGADGEAMRWDPEAAYVTNRTPSMTVATGGYRVYHAHGLEPGQFGLTLMGEYFGGSDVVRTDDQVRRFVGHLGLSWTPFPFIEAFAELSARAATNTLGDPELIQSVGDFSFGAKGFYEIVPGVHAGGLLRLTLPAGANSVGLDGSATSADILALSSIDLRYLADIPTRFHVNLGYLVDNSEQLFPFVLERVERFGHNVYDYNRVRMAFGVDAPLPYVTPSLEWTLEIPNGAACDSRLTQPCVTDNGFASYPSWLTIGASSAPFDDDLVLHMGVDLGLTTAESQGTPAVPAWNFLFGITYNLAPGRAEIVEVPVEVPVEVAPPTSYVFGSIVDADTEEPIAGAQIVYLDTEFSAQVTDEEGRFRSIDFPIGTEATIEVRHPSYQTRAMRVAFSEEVREGTIPLEPAFTGSRITGRVRAASGADIPATVSFRGDATYDIEVEADGSFVIDVDPGEYVITAHAPGYVATRMPAVLDPGREEMDFDLTPLPADSTLSMGPDGIELTEGITFEDGELTEASIATLADVAALMQSMPDLEVTVRSHTDLNEDRIPIEEYELTQARAQAVVGQLVEQGVDAGRLDAEGVGSDEPLLPNISDRNRRMNNRVEFAIR